MSATTRIAITAAVTLALPIVFVAAAAGALSAVFGSSGHAQPSADAIDDIPADHLALYQQAATVCPGLDWTILASIGKVESDHGRSPLPGVRSGGNPQAHAMGPMQIIPSTWASILARHQIPPGGSTPPSPYDPHDAAHAAAFLLCDSNITHDLRGAILAYNRADWYVEQVLAQAEQYGVPAPARPRELRLDWPPEAATMLDSTSNGKLTPRTHALVMALRANGFTGDGMTCFAPRPSNPASDHPRGKACDVFFDPHDPQAVAEGWHLVNWLIENQATYGVHYLIWQGQFWSAYDPQWVPYRSSAYGCPNPANLTGCHYDHVHWSAL